jgi:hypothetical protein
MTSLPGGVVDEKVVAEIVKELSATQLREGASRPEN